jgi:ketosteroid isomerase-like protein
VKQRNLLRTSIGFCLLCVCAIDAYASAAAQQSDPSVEQFWAKFKAAVQKSDKTSVANMSQFPIGMPYGVPKIRTRTQLTRRWRDLFNVQANAVKCFEDAKPVIDSTDAKLFTVGCKDQAGNEVVVYGFRRGRTGWKLIFLDNINE